LAVFGTNQRLENAQLATTLMIDKYTFVCPHLPVLQYTAQAGPMSGEDYLQHELAGGNAGCVDSSAAVAAAELVQQHVLHQGMEEKHVALSRSPQQSL